MSRSATNTSYQDYLNFLIRVGSGGPDGGDRGSGFDVPRDYPDHIRAGSDYEDLVARPGWKRLLDDLEGRANSRLAALRECRSNNPVIVKALRDRWVEAEESLKFIQIRAGETIENKREILADLSSRYGLDMNANDADVDVDGVEAGWSPEEREVVEYMNGIGQNNQNNNQTRTRR